LDVVSGSVPEPLLEPGDLLAVFEAPDAARDVVLAWERIEPADGAVGFVALGIDPDHAQRLGHQGGADPEGVTGHAARRIMAGGIPGALIGAVVVGVIAALIGGWTAFIGGLIGGALFGSIAGAMFVFVKQTGWGEAYNHSFVDPDVTSLAVASFHPTAPDHTERALAAVADSGASVYRV